MTKDEQSKVDKNTIVRVSFTPKEMEGVDLISHITGLRKPQDVLRYLLAQRIEKEKSQTLKYGSKRVARETEEGPQVPTIDERVDEVFRNPDPRMILGFLSEIGYYPMSAVGSIIPGAQYAATFTDEQRAQMPVGFENKTYIRIDNRGDIAMYPTDDPEQIAEVKRFLKGK